MTPLKNKKKIKDVSELRQDVVTGDWVVIATGRAKKPEAFLKRDKTALIVGKECLFCYPGIERQEPDTLIYYREDGEWSLRVFPNKYPSLARSKRLVSQEKGIYTSLNGVGFHEVIVTRAHEKSIPFLMKEEVAEIIDAYKTRYLDMMTHKNISYILFIENHGAEAGASIAHPHWQIFAVPVISPGINLELKGAENFKHKHRSCVYCSMVEQELEEQERLVAETENFVAFAPFASRAAFEVWIMPKKHEPYFERISAKGEMEVAQLLKDVLERYYYRLDDIPYNMYLHTSPCDGHDYGYYHWHIELLPKTAIWAGFELGTGIEVSTIQPEKAAAFLRKKEHNWDSYQAY